MNRILVIYGAFGRRRLERSFKDWSRAVIYENDARVPESIRRQAAAVISPEATYPGETVARLNQQLEDLLDAFLDDPAPMPGLETGRVFRSACMSMEGMRIVMPWLRALEEARRVVASGPFSGMIISPGCGLCVPAWEQVALSLGIPVRVLDLDASEPPLPWMLRRRIQRWHHMRGRKPPKSRAFKLPEFQPGDELMCVDGRVEVILGEAGAAAGWKRAPAFTPAEDEALKPLQEGYLGWWKQWWLRWQQAHAAEGPLSPHHALKRLGEWSAREVYPRSHLALQQAREHLKRLKPGRILVGTMHGKVELMWVVAARELGIEVGAYTLDDAIYPRLCFQPDFLFFDDQRQQVFAIERGIPENRMVPVRTHRLPAAAPRTPGVCRRPLVVIADTSYHGVNASPSPIISFWALEVVVEAARLLPGWDFAFKFHPIKERPKPLFNFDGCHHPHIYERERHFRSLRPPANVRVTAPEERFSDFMGVADVVLHIYSYAAIEAMAASIPAVLLATRNDDPNVAWRCMRDAGVLPVAADAAELVQTLRTLHEDGTQRKQVIEAQKRFLKVFHRPEGTTLAEATLAQWPSQALS
ncbi:MAG: hypothetical protein CJBNEKGG_00290 [Prosthecobacter sp.]|nr:hypothetical protein [Prosthecobacter sp.]